MGEGIQADWTLRRLFGLYSVSQMGGTIVQKLMRLWGLCHIMSAHHISQLNESKDDQESQQRCKTAFHSGLKKRDFKVYDNRYPKTKQNHPLFLYKDRKIFQG